MITDSFSFGRIERLLSAFVSENRRSLLLQCVLVVGVLVMMGVLACILHRDYMAAERDTALETLTVFYVLALSLFSAVSASLISTGLGGKAGRINTLMRPGNACEKFAARWLVYVLGFFIVFFIGLAIAEGVRMMLMSIFYPDHVVWPLFDSIFNGRLKEMFFSRATKSTGMIILCLMAPIVATQSFYVLGAMVWPRQSFLKTLVAEYALSFVYGLAAGITFMSLHSTGTWWASPGDDLPQWLALTLWLGGCAAVTVINYLLAWRRLAETDIISTRL